MARTPLAQRIEDAYAEVVESRTTQTRAGEADGGGRSRAGRSEHDGPLHEGGVRRGLAPRIAIVGAGLAGLTCALSAEAGRAERARSTRRPTASAGGAGRSETSPRLDRRARRRADRPGSHRRCASSAQELGLDARQPAPGASRTGTEDFFYVDGGKYTYSQLLVDLNGIYQKLHKDVAAASYPTLWNLYTPARLRARPHVDHRLARRDDSERRLEVEPGPRARHRLQHRVRRRVQRAELAQPASTCSATAVRASSASSASRTRSTTSRGGNDQVPRARERALEADLSSSTALTAIKQNRGGSYTLTFSTASGRDRRRPITSCSRSRSRSLRRCRLLEGRLRAAEGDGDRGAGDGNELEAARRVQRTASGTAPATTATHTPTPATRTRGRCRAPRAAARAKGILVDYTGGDDRRELRLGHAVVARPAVPRPRCEPLFPGVDIADHWTGRSDASTSGPGYQWTKGSYSYWKVGQYTKFSGMEEARQGNCHFCRRAHLAGLPGLPRTAPSRPASASSTRSSGDLKRVMAISENTKSEQVVADRERYVARGVATTPLVVAAR